MVMFYRILTVVSFLDEWFHIVDAQAGFKAACEAAYKVT